MHKPIIFNDIGDKTILITGATGSLGTACIEYLLKFEAHIRKIIIYSRDEHKQFNLGKKLRGCNKIRYFIGNIRDKSRLYKALKGVDYVIHAAALKHVHVCEYNPFEAVKTNITGTQNLIDTSIERNVREVVFVSTDKAVNPINLYGGTKFVAEKLFQAACHYSDRTDFKLVRLGNIAGSRGSIIPIFRKHTGTQFPIRNYKMSRFWITKKEAVEMVLRGFELSSGEILIPKMPSFKITDLATAINSEKILHETGIQKGEKIHEEIILPEEAPNTYDIKNYYVITSADPEIIRHREIDGRKVKDGFSYRSDKNTQWLTTKQLKQKLTRIQT